MKIDGNQKEKDVMAQFHPGNEDEGHRLQNEFIAEFRECVAIHRGAHGACAEMPPAHAESEGLPAVRADETHGCTGNRTRLISLTTESINGRRQEDAISLIRFMARMACSALHGRQITEVD